MQIMDDRAQKAMDPVIWDAPLVGMSVAIVIDSSRSIYTDNPNWLGNKKSFSLIYLQIHILPVCCYMFNWPSLLDTSSDTCKSA